MEFNTYFIRLTPTTIAGEQIAITTIYSSQNKEEIDKLEQSLRQTIGSGIYGECKGDEVNGNEN